MHIVQLMCSAAFAGVERYVLTVAEHLAHHEQVTVIGGAPEQLADRLAAHGAHWLPGTSRREALRSLRGLGKVDLIGTHMTDADLLGALARPAGTAVVSTRHFAAPRGSTTLARTVSRTVSKRIDAQIAISQYVADAIESPSHVIHTGVANVPNSPMPRERIVLVVQRLEPEKQTSDALRAWSQSSGPSLGWQLWIAGEGSQGHALKRLAGELGVTRSVRFLGFASDTSALYRRASVLIAPTPREGLGLVVLEAMAHGLPVVAADAGGHRETAGSVPGAALFPATDTVAAAELLDSLMTDPTRRAEYGLALQARQRRAFTVDSQLERTLRLYRDVVG